jgi:excisionase family DNA binding protein
MEYRTPDTGQGEQSTARLLTAQQAAECTGVHERTIRRAIARGELAAVKQHGVFRIDIGSLRVWADRRSTDVRPLSRPEAPTSQTLSRPPLLESVGALIGRERELAAATGMLAQKDVRLLTLTGAGGIGKTRFGLEVATQLQAHFPDGVYVVPLAEIASADLVISAIAETLGLPDSGGADRRDALITALHDARVLLVLDNYEHVIEAAPVVSDLLKAGPHIKVMVTSRALLRVRDEYALPVPPLELPDTTLDTAGQDAAASPAVQLFVDRARAVSPSFSLTTANTPFVIKICHHMGGLPLAIELAASQTNVLAPQALLARIEANLPLPFDGPRDAPDRQRTMTNAIAWSYTLLSPDEQGLFRRIGAFIGGFPLDAIEAMIASARIARNRHDGVQGEGSKNQGPSESDPLVALTTLVDSSLVQRDVQDVTRFTMLEPIRAFALNQLAAQDEFDGAHDALADWCLDLAEAGPTPAHPDGGEPYLMRLDLEQPNIRRSLTWLYEQHEVTRLLDLVVALGSYWYERNQYHEGRMWTERAVRMSACSTAPARGNALVQLGLFVSMLGDPARAGEMASEGISLLRKIDDPWSMSMSLIWQGGIAIQAGDYPQAEESLHEALNLAPRIPDGSVAAAISARAMSNLGATAHARGDLASATRWHDMALNSCREHGYLRGMSRSLCDLADVARDQEDYVASLSYYRECLEVLGERSDLRAVIAALEGAATAAAFWKQGEQAARLLGAAAKLGDVSRVPTVMSTDRTAHERAMRATRMMMDASTFDEMFAAGARLSQAESIAEALALTPPSEPRKGHHPSGNVASVLSSRESEVLNLLVAGQRDREIADALFISVRTVEGHVARILTKLGVTSRTAAVSAASTQGLVELRTPQGH